MDDHRKDPQPQSGGELFRMERSVMTKKNFDFLNSISGDRIPEALIEYICYEHQYNIFGYGRLDPEVFSKSFRLSFSHLCSRHPSPHQSRVSAGILPESKNLRLRSYRSGVCNADLLCDSRLENALYILGACPLKAVATSIRDKTLVRHTEFLRILESFTLVQESRTGKVTYLYKLDDRFRRNLASMYLTTSRESLIRLRRSNLGSLYVYLLTLRDALISRGCNSTTEEYTPDFNYLCFLAGVPQYDEAKYRKRDLNKAIEKIRKNTELRFEVEWVRGTGCERYTPLFHFETGLFTNGGPARVKVAVQEFVHNLVDVCPFKGNRYSSESEEFFFDWIQSASEKDITLFTYALEKTFIDMGCGIPGNISSRIRTFVRNSRHYGRNDFFNWLQDVFAGSEYFMPSFKCIEDKE